MIVTDLAQDFALHNRGIHYLPILPFLHPLISVWFLPFNNISDWSRPVNYLLIPLGEYDIYYPYSNEHVFPWVRTKNLHLLFLAQPLWPPHYHFHSPHPPHSVRLLSEPKSKKFPKIGQWIGILFQFDSHRISVSTQFITVIIEVFLYGLAHRSLRRIVVKQQVRMSEILAVSTAVLRELYRLYSIFNQIYSGSSYSPIRCD